MAEEKQKCGKSGVGNETKHLRWFFFFFVFQFSVRLEGVLVPHVVRCCVEEVERRGMDEVGIYRISGTAGDISTLKTAFNSSKTANILFLLACDTVLKDSKARKPFCARKLLETTVVTTKSRTV